MKRLLDLSLRYKLPLWGGLLIVVSVLAVSAALMFKAYEDLRQDMRSSAVGLGHILARTLFPVLLHDDVWRAFEQIHAASAGSDRANPVQAEAIFVVDGKGQIVVSSTPHALPMMARLDSLDPEYARLATALDTVAGDMAVFEFPQANRMFFAFPIREESAQVGTLVLTYSKDVFLPRFHGLALFGALVGVIVLAVLLPINWYWGRRMANPLVALARSMGQVVHGHRLDLDFPQESYPYRDELGQLFQAYGTMLEEMKQKSLLEQELLQTERLTAIGRLAAGIAHEINNPLGGMLLALDTLRERGLVPAQVTKTLGLLERGLNQIQETVAALLVQTRGQHRPLTPQDVEDVRMLIHPAVTKKFQHIDWEVRLPPQHLPSAVACRQILINLLLNAVQAAPEGGGVEVRIEPRGDGLYLGVANDAQEAIPPERMALLFEPFVSGHEGGHGLGLWVTYQIVQQLGGRIAATSDAHRVRFDVWLPLENTA